MSLVLSLALVASSIPTVFASAASTVSMAQTGSPEFAVVYDSANANAAAGEVSLKTLFASQKVKITDGTATKVVTDGAVADNTVTTAFDYSNATFAVSSSDNAVKMNAAAAKATGDVTTLTGSQNGLGTGKLGIADATGVAKVENVSTSGMSTATITASNVKVTTSKNFEVSKHNNVDTVTSGTVNLTVELRVYKTGATVVAVTPASAPSVGSALTTAETVGFNEAPTFTAYTVAAGTDAQAAYTPATGAKLALTGSSVKGASASGVMTIAAQATDKIPTSALTTSVYVVKPNTDSTKADNSIPASLTVGTYYTVSADASTTVQKTYGQPTKTILGGYDVTNRAIHVNSGILTVAGEDAAVGTVSGAGAVTVNSGTVGSIDVDGAVIINSTTANVGNIIVGDVTSAAAVTVTGATAANTDGSYSTVKVGNIDAVTVAIKTTQNSDKTAQGQVTVGNVVVTTGASVDTSTDVKTLTAGSFSGVQGDYADCPYAATFTLAEGTMTTGDLLYFQKVSVGDTAAASLTAGNIDTGTYATTAASGYGYSFEGKAAASTINIANSSKLDVASLKVEKIPTTCTGSLTVPAGKLTLADSSSDAVSNIGITLYVPNATSGTVLYTSKKEAGNVFTIPGIDTVKATSSSNNIYTYTADKVSFIGFKMNQTDVSLGQGASTTLTTTNLPAVDLPTGVTLKWSADKDSVKLAPSADTKSCVVTSTGYTDGNVNGSNNVVVTATLINTDGSAYTGSSTDKTFGTCNITLTPETAPVLTTTVTDLDGNVINATSDTIIPIQQSTELRVHFNADKAGITDINYITGNDKVAQTNTVSAWNGTSGVYTIYTNGAVGSKVGVFANGKRVFQVEIKDRPFKCDTSVDFSMKAGKTYTFKITPNAGTKIDTFTFLTGNDSKLSTWGCWKQADGTEMARVKAVSAGRYGVYAKINGVTYKVFAITVQ